MEIQHGEGKEEGQEESFQKEVGLKAVAGVDLTHPPSFEA
jgi:hypothetical protein